MNTLALSKWQKGIFLSEQKFQFNGLYTIFHIFEINGEYNLNQLKQSIHQLIAKYPIFKSKLNDQGILFYQEEFLPIFYEKKVSSYIELKNSLKPVHLIYDTLFQCDLFSLRESDQQYLVFRFHHIAFDGWSAQIFYHDFLNFYKNSNHDTLLKNKVTANHEAVCANDNTHHDVFFEYACLVKISDESNVSKQQYEYWFNKLNQLEFGQVLEYDDLNCDLKNCHSLTKSEICTTSDSQICQDVTSLSLSLRISEYFIYLAAFMLCLKKISGKNKILVSVAYANRDIPGTTRLMTNLVDLIILSQEIGCDDSFLDIVLKIKNEFMSSLKHQSGLCYSDIANHCVSSKYFPSAHPGFQIFFNFLETNFSEINFENGKLNLVEEFTFETAKFEFHFEIRNHKNLSKKTLSVVYARELFSVNTVDVVINFYQKWLVTVIQRSRESQIISKLMW